MKGIVRTLHLAQRRTDAQRVQRALMMEGIRCRTTVVQSRVAFTAALARGKIDLILSDYQLRHFSGLAAPALARERCPAVPFVFFSDSVGERRAVETIKRGAADFVLKSDGSFLGMTVARVLNDSSAQENRTRCALSGE